MHLSCEPCQNLGSKISLSLCKAQREVQTWWRGRQPQGALAPAISSILIQSKEFILIFAISCTLGGEIWYQCCPGLVQDAQDFMVQHLSFHPSKEQPTKWLEFITTRLNNNKKFLEQPGRRLTYLEILKTVSCIHSPEPAGIRRNSCKETQWCNPPLRQDQCLGISETRPLVSERWQLQSFNVCREMFSPNMMHSD